MSGRDICFRTSLQNRPTTSINNFLKRRRHIVLIEPQINQSLGNSFTYIMNELIKQLNQYLN